MNAQLKQMIRAGSPKDRAILAAIVQADIDHMARQHIALANRQHQLVSQLIAAGITHIPGTDDVISFEGIAEGSDLRHEDKESAS